MTTPFDYINSISHSKVNMMEGTENDELAEKSYESFIVNRGLSLYVDCVLFANEMNMLNHLDKKCQYDYLINSIRQKKRWSKWPKKIVDEDINLIKKAFGYNTERAREALSLLSIEQINEIRELNNVGGKQ